MEEVIIQVLKSLKDPILILVFAVICGLYYLFVQQGKNLCTDVKKTNENLADCNITMAKLVTLVEVLVHGRK
jgi:succinate dehydrogenase hydrophobic anchor subunit